MAMSAVSTVRTIAQSLGKGGAQPQGGAELHTQALVRNSDDRGDTGSFRKNGKSKTVFMGIKFHEKLIFSAFFSRELATNLRS